MTKKFVVVTGLPGIGKSEYITESPLKDYIHLESRSYFDAARERMGESMNHHELTVYARAICFSEVMLHVVEGEEVVVLEWPGVVRTSQSFLRTLMDAVAGAGYEIQIIYLLPSDLYGFARKRSSKNDQYAYEAANDVINGVSRYRHANECPYFEHVDVIQVPIGK